MSGAASYVGAPPLTTMPKRQLPKHDTASSRVSVHRLRMGARVSSWQLGRLKKNVLDEAMLGFEAACYVEALDGFAHCLAIEESLRWRDPAFTAAVEYNIGACLHCLREFEEASVSSCFGHPDTAPHSLCDGPNLPRSEADDAA